MTDVLDQRREGIIDPIMGLAKRDSMVYYWKTLTTNSRVLARLAGNGP